MFTFMHAHTHTDYSQVEEVTVHDSGVGTETSRIESSTTEGLYMLCNPTKLV